MNIDTAIFTCYFPDKGFRDNLTRAAMQFDFVIVIANDGDQRHKELEKIYDNIHIIISESNLGISTAFNKAVHQAENLKSDFIFLFDQDSKISNEFKYKMHEIYDSIAATGLKLILGANYSNSESDISLLIDSSNKYVSQYAIISSGSMMRLEDYLRIGGYNEFLFIDYCDIDFCFRARVLGFKIFITTESLMYHDIGSYIEVDLKMFKLRYTEHSELRVMYMFRNAVLLSKRYFFVYPNWVLLNLFKRIKSLILILLVDKKRVKKIRAVIKGIIEGIFNKY